MQRTERKLRTKGEVPELDRPLTIIGKQQPRIDGVAKVTGGSMYAGDFELKPGMLYMKILRSPFAHARIKRINSTKAEALPGVHAIIHKGKFPDWKMYFYLIPQKVFPEDVTWVGEEVAVVAAESIDLANKAVEMIEVEYEQKPHVLGIDEALAPGAPIIPTLDEVEVDNVRAPKLPPVGNVFEGKPEVLKRGDPDKGFSEADIIYEDTYTVQFQYHAPLQTRVAIADWDGNKLTVQESCQGLWMVREDMMKSLNLTEDQIRLIVKYQGGGFGSKAGAQRYLHFVSRLAMLTGKPVRFEQTRPEEFVSHPHRWSSKMWLKTGMKLDGTLTAMEGKFLVNCGTGGTYGNQKDQMILTPWKLYECPNVELEQYGVYTNAQLTGYMRGVMVLMGNFAMESHMDKMADMLKLDPIHLRMKNYTMWGNQVKKIPYSAKNLDRCMKIVTDNIGWDRRESITESNKNKKIKRGIGMAAALDGGTGYPPFKAMADVVLSSDGTAKVIIGTVDIGGGQATVMGMIAAEELGVSMDRVRVQWGDTEGTKYSPSTHANRVTAELGPAVQEAAYDARRQLFEFASKKMDALPDRLRSANDIIYVKDDPDRAISFDEVLESLPPEGVSGTGSRTPNPSDWEFNVFSAKACEVEVDTETGHVSVLKFATAHEVGRALNPQAVESQLYGGIVMGLGFAMTEEPWIDEKTGTMLNPDLHQYRPGTILECPEIAAFAVEAEDPFFAFSAKALGNGVLIGVAPAVRAAVAHATGIWINDLPITPVKILDALYGTDKKAKDSTKSQQPFMAGPHLSSSVKAKDYVDETGE